MWKRKFISKKLTEWFQSHDDYVPYDKVDDPHDNADPQRITYIFGGGVEGGGKWL